MTDTINTYFRVAEFCTLCNKPFSAEHAPIAIRACGHIFGYRCLLVSLHGGDVDLRNTWLTVRNKIANGAKCPDCQLSITDVDSKQKAISILRDISSDIPEHQSQLNAFIEQLRDSVAKTDPDLGRENIVQFFKKCYTSDGDDILQKALHETASAGDYFSPFHDAITASRSGDPQPMAFPLIRFCFLLWDVHNAIRRKSSLSINVLLWEGNRCLGVDNPLVRWEDIETAANVERRRLFPLLHCLTMLVSQALARTNLKEPWTKQEEVELAERLACTNIGPHFEGRPSHKWLNKLAVVVTELKRHQFEMGRKPLTGLAAEKSIVRGWWAIANLETEDVVQDDFEEAE